MNLTTTSPRASDADTLAAFANELGRFFNSQHIVQIDWDATGKIHVLERGGAVSPQERSIDGSSRLPFADGHCDTVFNLGSLASLPLAVVDVWLAELHRVTRRNLWIALEALPGRNQNWWERRFFEVGFRKHPFTMVVCPYSERERDATRVLLVLEKIPAAALARYPLTALKAERDLHMDMLREAGIRSEAHLARYQLAARHAPEQGIILDAACGLGYGSAMLARQFPGARVIGIDISEYAVDYARTNFAAELPNLEFHVADACDLTMVVEDSVDLVVSFETIEHVPDPELFLRGVARRMKAGARFIGSVPNLWLDETGKDPNPWHFHVFDLPKFYQLMAGHLQVSHVYRENAGGHLRNTKAGPDMREVRLPVTDQLEEAEWWLIAAQKPDPRAGIAGPKPRIWLVDGDVRGRFYTQLQSVLDADWLAGPDVVPDNLDLAIVSDEFCWENSLEVQQLKRLGVPTLHVVDGVVDWKNTWENPRSLRGDAGLPLFQPVLCDKIACLGPVQARIFSAWGNASKCELVGAPRFDRYYTLKRRTRKAEEPARVLILTANTAYFNAEQHAAILTGLKDLRDFFAAAANDGIPVEPVWRLTSGLTEELGLPPPQKGSDLADVLTTVDAVIGGSSTALLEAMMLGLPTALLDYSNVPHYLQPAWQITAEAHIGPVLGELLNPSHPRMLQQEMTLHDNLACASPATTRLANLVSAMIIFARQARERGETPVFPADLLARQQELPRPRENRFDLAKLHPEHAVFRISTFAELQAELNHWHKRHAAFHGPSSALRAGSIAGEGAVRAYSEATLLWRAKLEGAQALVSLGQNKAAVDLMLQGIKAVESCKDARIILEALLAIGSALGKLDGGRARFLLETAQKLATRLGKPEAVRLASDQIAKIPAPRKAA